MPDMHKERFNLGNGNPVPCRFVSLIHEPGPDIRRCGLLYQGIMELPLMSGISPHQLEDEDDDDDDDDTHRSRLVSRNGISQILALRFSFIGDIWVYFAWTDQHAPTSLD
ncbi:uncharacterized protein PADG_12283 [Paracoccidioides brasiliensis Pb18]|uniref:Uncharacterized protein n=1 Tax=Paracoccidioides brasiliensis (strain Pb18) TaxID=502780 RepID=A0A0A0HSG8_PARBD|nr:uncharacterized protein PADG_12283 [Paracoccidioides brasiliensis Pb18]KGM91602.1 hypothetical protein PADG_12283 [Paracoccidioides brasiliensis Pb18]